MWTTEPVDEARTRVRLDWQTHTHGVLFGIVASVMDVGGAHSSVVQKGFSEIGRHIAAARGLSQSRPQSS